MSPKSIPGAIHVAGTDYLKDSRNRMVPVGQIRPQDLLMHELVYRLCGYARDLSSDIARFQVHCYADLAAFEAVLAQEYGLERNDDGKGNRTFTSLDGLLQVKICIQDRITFGPELGIAKQLLDAMILERAEGADPFLVTLVARAFKVDKQGAVDFSDLLALRRLDIQDPRWPDVCRAIDDAQRPLGSKRYLRFYRREAPDGKFEQVALDLAAVEPTAADLARPSLRRTKEDAAKLVGVGITYLLDGAWASGMDRLMRAAELLGADVNPAEVSAWIQLRRGFGPEPTDPAAPAAAA